VYFQRGVGSKSLKIKKTIIMMIILPSCLKILSLGLKRKTSHMTLLVALENNTFLLFLWWKKGVSYNMTRVSYAFNDSHILGYLVEYCIILLMRYQLYEWEMWYFLREIQMAKFSKTLMN
jgi:hypothetical protein